MSIVKEMMKDFGIPMTRQNYLEVEYLGKAKNPDPETEAEIPDEPRFKAFPETTHEQVAAEEAEKEKSKKK